MYIVQYMSHTHTYICTYTHTYTHIFFQKEMENTRVFSLQLYLFFPCGSRSDRGVNVVFPDRETQRPSFIPLLSALISLISHFIVPTIYNTYMYIWENSWTNKPLDWKRVKCHVGYGNIKWLRMKKLVIYFSISFFFFSIIFFFPRGIGPTAGLTLFSPIRIYRDHPLYPIIDSLR